MEFTDLDPAANTQKRQAGLVNGSLTWRVCSGHLLETQIIQDKNVDWSGWTGNETAESSVLLEPHRNSQLRNSLMLSYKVNKTKTGLPLALSTRHPSPTNWTNKSLLTPLASKLAICFRYHLSLPAMSMHFLPPTCLILCPLHLSPPHPHHLDTAILHSSHIL